MKPIFCFRAKNPASVSDAGDFAFYRFFIISSISKSEVAVESKVISVPFVLPLRLNHTVFIPAFLPPRISEVRLSPMMTVSSFEKFGIWEKQKSKNSFLGFSHPTFSEMKIPLKYFSIPELASLLS